MCSVHCSKISKIIEVFISVLPKPNLMLFWRPRAVLPPIRKNQGKLRNFRLKLSLTFHLLRNGSKTIWSTLTYVEFSYFYLKHKFSILFVCDKLVTLRVYVLSLGGVSITLTCLEPLVGSIVLSWRQICHSV